MKKSLLSFLLIFVLLFSCFPCSAEEPIDEKANILNDVSFYKASLPLYSDAYKLQYEEYPWWGIMDDGKTLLIRGYSGTIKDYYARLWEPYCEEVFLNESIERLILCDGITEIDNSFNDFKNLRTVILPSTLKKVSRSFLGCDALNYVEFTAEPETVDAFSFYDCPALEWILLEDKALSVNAFFRRFAEAGWRKARRNGPPTGNSLENIDPIEVTWDDFQNGTQVQNPTQKEAEKPTSYIFKNYIENPVHYLLYLNELADDHRISGKFDAKTQTLTLSGTGEINNYFPADWDEFYETFFINTTIKHLVIEEGITGIKNSFHYLTNLVSVSFPASLKEIDRSFIGCGHLSLTFAGEKESFQKIDTYSFSFGSIEDIHFAGIWMPYEDFFNAFAPEGWEEDQEWGPGTETDREYLLYEMARPRPEDYPMERELPKTPPETPYWIGGGVILALLAGAGALLFFKKRRKQKTAEL